MANRRLQLPEHVVPGQRLGRNINHDPRSLRFLVGETSTPQTAHWDRRIPVLTQVVGSCTGEALIGVLGTDPYYSMLTPAQQAALTQAEAERVYSLATHLDPFEGSWEPDDTGSDGLSAAKAGQRLGYLSGYQHITSLAAAHNAIKNGPFMSGLLWLSGMDDPTPEGVVHATGRVRGGHEWEFAGYDAATGLWECWQSWGEDWGRGGRFYLSDEDYAYLLGQQGDATTVVPVTQPAPIPDPVPVPPDPLEPRFLDFPMAEFAAFEDHPYSIKARKALIAGVKSWARL